MRDACEAVWTQILRRGYSRYYLTTSGDKLASTSGDVVVPRAPSRDRYEEAPLGSKRPPLDPRPQKQCILIKIEYNLLFRVFFWGTGCSRIRRSQIGPHAIRRYIWRQSSLQQKLRRRNPSLLRILRHPHRLKMTLKFFRLLRNLLHPPLHRRRLRHHQDRQWISHLYRETILTRWAMPIFAGVARRSVTGSSLISSTPTLLSCSTGAHGASRNGSNVASA